MRTTGVFLTHDLFARGGGLGAAAAWVYEGLSSTPVTTVELSEATNLHLRTVQRCLRALAHRDLAEKTAAGTWVKGGADIDALARRRGSAGASADLKERHRQERADHQRYERSASGSMIFTMRDVAEKRLCTATKRDGSRCHAWAVRDRDQCVRHVHHVLGEADHEAPSPEAHDWVQELENATSFQYELQALQP